LDDRELGVQVGSGRLVAADHDVAGEARRRPVSHGTRRTALSRWEELGVRQVRSESSGGRGRWRFGGLGLRPRSADEQPPHCSRAGPTTRCTAGTELLIISAASSKASGLGKRDQHEDVRYPQRIRPRQPAPKEILTGQTVTAPITTPKEQPLSCPIS